MSSGDHESELTRRTALKVIGLGAIASIPLSMAEVTSAQQVQRSTSFEEANVGDPEPADPWYLFEGEGIHEVSDVRSTHGTQSFHTADSTEDLGTASAVAVDLDLTRVENMLFDIYVVKNNPSFGNINISLDGAGTFSGADHVWSFPGEMRRRNRDPFGGEGRWWRDLDDDRGTLASSSGVHSLVCWIDGDQDVFWDNIRLVLSVIEVNLDIKPGSDPNSINPNSKGNTPVAILHTEDFDPTERVNVSSLRFGDPEDVDQGGGASPAHGGHIEDVDGDSDDDLVVHFPTPDMGFDGDEDTGKLIGETDDGTPIVGTDSVNLVGGGDNDRS